MKLVFSLIFILFGLISYSQVEYFELEYAPDEHYFLKSKLSPLGEWDTIYLDDLKTLLGITSGGVSDGVVDTVFIDKNELNIEVLNPDSTITKFIVDLTSYINTDDQILSVSDVISPTFRRYTLTLEDGGNPIIIDDVFVDPNAVKYGDTTAMLNKYVTFSEIPQNLDNDPLNEIQDLSGLVNVTDTAAMLLPYTNYWTKSGNQLGYTLGNVGIGTLTPSERFHVYNGEFLVEEPNASAANFKFKNSVNTWTFSNNAIGNLTFRPSVQDNDFAIRSLNGDFYHRIQANGRVTMSFYAGDGNGLLQANNTGILQKVDYADWDTDKTDDLTIADLFWTQSGTDIKSIGNDNVVISNNLEIESYLGAGTLEDNAALVIDLNTNRVESMGIMSSCAFEKSSISVNSSYSKIDWTNEIYDYRNTLSESGGDISAPNGFYDVIINIENLSTNDPSATFYVAFYNGNTQLHELKLSADKSDYTIFYVVHLGTEFNIRTRLGSGAIGSSDDVTVSLTQKTFTN